MKLIKVFLLIALVFTFFIKLDAQNVSDKNNPGATLDEYLRRATANGFSGAVLVAKDGKIVLRNFATYDLFKGRTINVTFRADGNLVVKTKDGDVIAQKIQTSKKFK